MSVGACSCGGYSYLCWLCRFGIWGVTLLVHHHSRDAVLIDARRCRCLLCQMRFSCLDCFCCCTRKSQHCSVSLLLCICAQPPLSCPSSPILFRPSYFHPPKFISTFQQLCCSDSVSCQPVRPPPSGWALHSSALVATS
jgi:hypothetical protein